jgi:hypothetical protein
MRVGLTISEKVFKWRRSLIAVQELALSSGQRFELSARVTEKNLR